MHMLLNPSISFQAFYKIPFWGLNDSLILGQFNKGPSIYDVHMEGEGSGSGGRGRGVQAPCGRPHRKLKIESTDVILSSSHAKKLVYFFTRISFLDGIKSGNFSAI